MSRIFISYRRRDAPYAAGRIYEELESHFGSGSTFIDVDALQAGEDVQAKIQEVVGRCQIFLAVIGHGWLAAKDQQGRRRLDNPADWVRLEIEAALKRKVTVIPVLLDGVLMPQISELPESLHPLAYRQAAFVRHGRDFRVDIARLMEVIQQRLEIAERQAELEEEQKRREQQRLEALRQAEAEAQERRERERAEAERRAEVERQAEIARQQRIKQQAESAQIAATKRKIREQRKAARTGSEDQSVKRAAVRRPVRPVSISSEKQATVDSLFSVGQQSVGRRGVLKMLGYSAGGLGVVLAGDALRRAISSNDSQAIELLTTEFEVATITDVTSGAFEITRKTGEFFTETVGDGVTLDLMKIPSGTFTMGSPPDESERGDDEGPQHEVSVPSFFMGRYAVTQAQWRAVAALPKVDRDLEPSPSSFEGDDLPVENVNWNEAVEFCDRLSAKTNRTYRLPSEAEWEYACRAGTTTPFHFGNTITPELGNYNAKHTYNNGLEGEYRKRTTEVGNFPANAFGLHDMHGNVWDWCQDQWHSNYEGAPTDGSAWLTGNTSESRVLRGGSWADVPWYCRSAFRFLVTPDNRCIGGGFRVSCHAPRTLT